MKILGIDTTTRFLCLGIYDGKRVYEYNLELGVRLSALITVTIKRVLGSLGWEIKDIDYFACGLGPGSFTGMRVGIASVKGLAFSADIPVAGISTLDILARNCRIEGNYVIPVVDAKRGLVYTSIYKNKKGKLHRLAPYMLLSMDEFLKKIKFKGSAAVLGDGVALYKEKILKYMKNITVLDKDYWYPVGRNIIDLAVERISQKKVKSAFEINPVYLYPKECQVRNFSANVKNIYEQK